MNIRHKGLRRYWQTGNARGIRADMTRRLHRRLSDLDKARGPSDLAIPSYRLHPLMGDLAGYWSIHVTGNWRLTFRFRDGEVVEVDLVDYH